MKTKPEQSKLDKIANYIGGIIGLALLFALASALLSSCSMTKLTADEIQIRREIVHQQDKLWSDYSYKYDSLQIIYNNVGKTK